MEIFDYLEKKYVIEKAHSSLDEWKDVKSVIRYFAQEEDVLPEAKDKVERVDPEVVESVAQGFLQSIEKYKESRAYDSETWGNLLENLRTWGEVKDRLEKYCQDMSNLGCERKEKEKKINVDSDLVFSRFGEVEVEDHKIEEIEGDKVDKVDMRECLVCGVETPKCLFSCAACSAPFWEKSIV